MEWGIRMDLANRKSLMSVMAVATAVFFGGTLAYAHWSSEGWYDECADDFDFTSFAAVSAIDPSGNMHVVYQASDYGTPSEIRHAVRSGNDWAVSSVGYASDYSRDLEMMIGEDSVVRIAWRYGPSICYADNSGGDFETTSAVIENISDCAIALDPSGKAHALVTTHEQDEQTSYTSYEFEHWTVSSGEWELVATYDGHPLAADQYAHTLLFSPDGDPYAFFWVRYNFSIYYTLMEAPLGDAPLEFAYTYAHSGNEVILDAAYDSQGDIHLIMRESDEPSRLSHWFGAGTNREMEMIDYAGDSSVYGAELYIDDQDTVYVAYSSYFEAFSSRQCEVAKKTDEGWTLRDIHLGDGSCFVAPSLAVDSDGVYRVAGFSMSGNGGYLVYASSDGHEVLVDSLSDAGLWTAMAAVIGWPTGFAVARWHRIRMEKRARLESIGLYDHNLRKVP